MEVVTLDAKARPTRSKAKALLRQNIVPGIVYGHGFPNEAIVVDKAKLQKVFERAGHSSLVNLMLHNKKPYQVLIHHIQYHPISDEPIHLDLYRVKMTEKIKTEIPLKLIGEAPAIEELQGTLIQNKDHLRVEALPQDLVHEIEVDVSVLRTFEVKIHIKDLNIPKGIELQEDPEEVVALVQPPRSEEELAELEEKVEEKIEQVEVEEKGKEEEAGAEEAITGEPQLKRPVEQKPEK